MRGCPRRGRPLQPFSVSSERQPLPPGPARGGGRGCPAAPPPAPEARSNGQPQAAAAERRRAAGPAPRSPAPHGRATGGPCWARGERQGRAGPGRAQAAGAALSGPQGPSPGSEAQPPAPRNVAATASLAWASKAATGRRFEVHRQKLELLIPPR